MFSTFHKSATALFAAALRRRLGLLWGLVLGSLASATQPAQAGTLTIVPMFDSTITGASNAAQIEAAINSAVGTINSLYSTPNTVSVNVYFQQRPLVLGTLVGFTADIEAESYTNYTNALKADSTANPGNTVLSTAIANLSKGNGSSGTSDIAATSVLLRTLGFTAPPCFSATGNYNCGASGHPFDAILTLASNRPLDYTRPIPASPTEYDGLGIIEHGLNEVLGGGRLGSTLNDRISCSTNPSNFFCDKFGPLDLYRYSAPNAPSFTTSGSANSYFSVDGGVTNIVGFNQISSLDFGDFNGNNFGCPGADAFIQDAITCPNQQRENYTTASPEYSMLLSIGYDPVPEPGTLTLLGTSLLGIGALRRRQTRRPR